MLSVVRAIHDAEEVPKGGSTKPRVVLAVDSAGEVKRYVIKLFSERTLAQQHALAKEVMGNVLARAFELAVPEAVLIELDDAFFATLTPETASRYQQADRRIKFGTQLREDFQVVDPHLETSFLLEYDMATVYGFDNLLWNLDRGGGRKKPNLLVNGEEFLLIDHEQIFPFADDIKAVTSPFIVQYQQADQWRYRYQEHLFYPHLRRLSARRKKGIFDTFSDYLKQLPTQVLDPYVTQLAQYAHLAGNYQLIRTYLGWMKQNTARFVRTLEQTLDP